MQRTGLLISISILMVFLVIPSHAKTPVDPLKSALAMVDLTCETARFNPLDLTFFGSDEFKLPIFDVLAGDPWAAPRHMRAYEEACIELAGDPSGILTFATRRLNKTVRRGYYYSDPLNNLEGRLDPEGPLIGAISGIHTQFGTPLLRGDIDNLANELSIVPLELHLPCALVIQGAYESLRFQDMAYSMLPDELIVADAIESYFFSEDEEFIPPDAYRAMREFDYRYMYGGAEDIALMLKRAHELFGEYTAGTSDFEYIHDSPLGKIVISDDGASKYYDDDYFCIFDFTGDDRYYAGGAAYGPDMPVGIIYDAGGDDRYIMEDENRPAFGSGFLGYGFLFDCMGDDKYEGNDMCFGSGIFGVGMLWDIAGDDEYDAVTSSLGSGQFGIGILMDNSGDDRYHSYQTSQGYGYVLGMGLLVDTDGDDRYISDDEDIRFPGGQTKDHNSSLSQGFGFGRRADVSEGHSMAGGVGFLIDGGGGDDFYLCGVFGQGAAYWYGVGLLADDGGNDRYTGVWYVQGSGAHFAFATLLEEGGNDHYIATHNMAQGAGHDFTVGMLLDISGNDIYEPPNLSLGGGNSNGIGVLIDWSGDDKYLPLEKAGTTLGRAGISGTGSLRDYMLCLGLFMDLGGDDVYGRDFASNNDIWTQSGYKEDWPRIVEKGVGLDGEYPDFTFWDPLIKDE